ncbi:MAG: hypothetical protein KDB07_09370 [Planctomycetes bacterium]|nr:hypothetical protein [Planctomycetota bacterium]
MLLDASVLIPFSAIAAIIGVGIWLAYLSHKKEKERVRAVLNWAEAQGFRVRKGDDRASNQRFMYFDLMRAGSNQYFTMQVSGDYEGLPFLLFDYHYETYSTDKNGNRRTHHHYFTACIIETGLNFPAELRLRPEGFFDKFAAVVGFDDIDFESHEFSKRFHVKSKDRKFAYDLIHQGTMEYLLKHLKTHFEIERNAIMVHFGQKRLAAPEYAELLRHTRHLLELTPDYFIEQAKMSRG